MGMALKGELLTHGLSENPLWWLLLERDDGNFQAAWCF
jgi:hypothetical protein